MTLGGQGALIVRDEDVVAVEAVPVEVVDTIGAGDAFMGAFLAHWRSRGLGRAELGRREELVEATRFACRVAALTCAGRAPSRRGAPSWTARRSSALGGGLAALAAGRLLLCPVAPAPAAAALAAAAAPLPDFFPPLLEASGVLAIAAARLLLILLAGPSYCLSSLTLGPWSFAIVLLTSAVRYRLRVTRLIGRQPRDRPPP